MIPSNGESVEPREVTQSVGVATISKSTSENLRKQVFQFSNRKKTRKTLPEDFQGIQKRVENLKSNQKMLEKRSII